MSEFCDLPPAVMEAGLPVDVEMLADDVGASDAPMPAEGLPKPQARIELRNLAVWRQLPNERGPNLDRRPRKRSSFYESRATCSHNIFIFSWAAGWGCFEKQVEPSLYEIVGNCTSMSQGGGGGGLHWDFLVTPRRANQSVTL
jgi:hypothetical protein